MVHSFPKGPLPLVDPVRGNILLAGVHLRALVAPVTVLLHGAKSWLLLEEMEWIGADMLGVETIGRGAEVLGKLGDIAQIAVDRVGRVVAERRVGQAIP
jgi:hypothetical protein